MLLPLHWTLAALLVEPITRLLAPSRPAPTDVSRDELRLLVEQSAREGPIGALENTMLQGVVALAQSRVWDAIVVALAASTQRRVWQGEVQPPTGPIAQAKRHVT